MSSMVADRFHYQVDVIGGDGNSAAYRFGGSNQNSSSNEQSLFQEVFKSFQDAYVSCQGGDLALSPKVKIHLQKHSVTMRRILAALGMRWRKISS